MIQSKTSVSGNQRFSSANKSDLSNDQFSSINSTNTNECTRVFSYSNGQGQLFARRNLFQPQPQQFPSEWATTAASEDGEGENQGQESVRKFCTEDTPISLSKAGSNTNLSSLTFDDEDVTSTGPKKCPTTG